MDSHRPVKLFEEYVYISWWWFVLAAFALGAIFGAAAC